ncbi:response regulator [Argonema antarcticum]|uniref:hybrid sensor histidine kinase/response regulator n=1 Tax=Argonema antarcticum TaxID=2942763 RepID=UPI002011CE0A|nr:response regulator [Argonema antarcticum]MCL1474813.1 response regulator [Argonema antarcticum A004/B2]
MLPEQKNRILGYFIEEAKDHLNTIQQGLLSLQNTIDDPEMVKEVFRAAHSVKGGAAMLGIHSIQKTSHRLEDYFKELEERPIQVDRKLENLFLRVFDTLQSLLEHLQGPFGLTDDVAESVMSGVDPVFEELKQHLELLANGPPKATVVEPKPSGFSSELLLKTFKQDVMEVLRQMLQLFKPPSWPDSRPQLQECCSRLIGLGERFNLPAWINLVQMTENAIANPDNSSQTLAPVIIKEIKAAQELVLAGRPNDISIGEQLLELQPAVVQVQAELERSDDESDLFSVGFDPESTSDIGETEVPDSFSFPSSDNDYDFAATTPDTALNNFDWSETPHTVRSAEPSGPEVGAAELNSLADIFETDLELDATWQEEEILTDAAVESAPDMDDDLDVDGENEFADLFEDVSEEPSRSASGQLDDDLSWFDDSFSEDDEMRSPARASHHLDIIDDIEDETLPDLFNDSLENSATAQDQFSLFDEAIFEEDSTRDLGSADLDLDNEDGGDETLLHLFESDSEIPTKQKPASDDDFSLFDETFTDDLTSNESAGAQEFNFNVSDSDSNPGSHPSPNSKDNLSELFVGLDEDDFWEELPQKEDIGFEAETLTEQISDDLSTEDSSDWDNDWANADEIANLEESPDFSSKFPSFEYEEQDLELPIEEEKVEPQISNLESEINAELDFSGLDDRDITWTDETDPEEIGNLAAFTDDFDELDLFAETPTEDREIKVTQHSEDLFDLNDFADSEDLDLGSLSEPTLEADSAYSDKKQAAAVSLATENEPFSPHQKLGTEESIDSFFSLDQETTTEFWGEELEDPKTLEQEGGLDDESWLTPDQDIFSDSSSEDFWNMNQQADASPAALMSDFDSDGGFDLFGSSDNAVFSKPSAETDLTAEFDLDSFGVSDGVTAEEFDGFDASSDENWALTEEEKQFPPPQAQLDENWDSAEDNDDIFAPFSPPQNSEYEQSDFALDFEADVQNEEITLFIEDSTVENWMDWDTPESEEGQRDRGAEETEAPVGDGKLDDFEIPDFFDGSTETGIDFIDLPQTEMLSENESEEHETLAWLEDDFSTELDTSPQLAQEDSDEAENDAFLALFQNPEDEEQDFSLNLETDPESGESLSSIEDFQLESFDDGAEFDFENADVAGASINEETRETEEHHLPLAHEEQAGGGSGVHPDGLLDDFAELEALLTVESSPAPSQELEVNTQPSTVNALDDFAELEALLEGESLGKPNTAPVAAQSTPSVSSPVTASDTFDLNFDELERMVADVEKGPGGMTGQKPRTPQATPQKRQTRAWFEQTMKVPVKHMDNLSNLVGELVVNRNTLEQDQERLRLCLDNLLNQVQQLSDVGARMQDLYERTLLEASLLASRKNYRSSLSESSTLAHHLGSGEYDPLEMDRFTGFHSLSQEMIELIVRVRESTSDIEFVTDETEQVSRQFRQVSTQLQEGLTRARMVPFGEIERIFPLLRYVRDKAAESGKQAEIRIEGRETLIDKLILEHFSDPLKHLVNNALAHGVESPEVRQRAGKPPVGRISIRAFHQGNQTVISFSDDGAGIDVERVKAKAIEKGLITKEEGKTISRHDVHQLIYHPGFSVKDEADLLAGKGIGMDVVLTSLSEIRGTITTDSTPGKGTTFTIRLPLTLSICKALCCLSEKARIAFPMDGVEDALDIEKDRIQINEEGEQCVPWRDMILPFRPLSDLMTYHRQLGRGSVYGGSKEEDTISIVVLRTAGNFIALQVDQVLGEQEIVIKQIEGPIPKPLGVAGATVLGDGRIMPIGDVLELIDLSLGRIQQGGNIWRDRSTGITIEEKPVEPTVLIVDDSITVRELLSMTFNKAGYRVEQARDGQEAWDKLKSGLPCEIVFCDIEMPRMDGLELLSRLQKDPDLNHLPVAMLTSRGAEKHRQMAVERGARGYFTKPYLEEALLDAASRMLKGEVLVTSSSNV